jgi:hypothetical protein
MNFCWRQTARVIGGPFVCEKDITLTVYYLRESSHYAFTSTGEREHTYSTYVHLQTAKYAIIIQPWELTVRAGKSESSMRSPYA